MRRRPALVVWTLLAAAMTAGVAFADEAARFRALLEKEWTVRLAESPLLATYVGVHTSDDRLGDDSEEGFARRERETRAFLEALSKVDRAALPPTDQVSYDLFGAELADRLDARKFGEEQLLLNADSGFHTALARLPEEVSLATVQDYDNYLARLRQFPRVFDESIALMRRGLARGMTPPRVAIAGVDATAAAHAVATPEESDLFKPFADFPATFAAADRDRLLAAGRQAVEEAVLPSYRRFRDFLRDE